MWTWAFVPWSRAIGLHHFKCKRGRHPVSVRVHGKEASENKTSSGRTWPNLKNKQAVTNRLTTYDISIKRMWLRPFFVSVFRSVYLHFKTISISMMNLHDTDWVERLRGAKWGRERGKCGLSIFQIHLAFFFVVVLLLVKPKQSSGPGCWSEDLIKRLLFNSSSNFVNDFMLLFPALINTQRVTRNKRIPIPSTALLSPPQALRAILLLLLLLLLFLYPWLKWNVARCFPQKSAAKWVERQPIEFWMEISQRRSWFCMWTRYYFGTNSTS